MACTVAAAVFGSDAVWVEAAMFSWRVVVWVALQVWGREFLLFVCVCWCVCSCWVCVSACDVSLVCVIVWFIACVCACVEWSPVSGVCVCVVCVR